MADILLGKPATVRAGISRLSIRPHDNKSGQFKVIVDDDDFSISADDDSAKADDPSSMDVLIDRESWREQFSDGKALGTLTSESGTTSFTTRGFKERGDGKYVAIINPIDLSDDAITGRLTDVSLQLKSSDVVEPVVEGLAGFAALGAGIALYYKMRSKRAIEALEEEAVDLEADLAKASQLAENLEIDVKTIRRGYARLAADSEQYEILENRIKDLRYKYNTDPQARNNADFRQELTDRINEAKAQQSEIEETWDREYRSVDDFKKAAQDKFDDLNNKLRSLDKANEEQKLIQARLNAIDKAEDILARDLEAAPSELLEQDSFYQRLVAEQEVGSEELGETFLKEAKDSKAMLDEIYNTLFANLRKAGVPEDDILAMIKDVGRSIRQSNEVLFEEVSEELGLVRGGTAVERIDPIVDFFADEFKMSKSIVLRADNVTGALLDDLPALGYAAEGDLLIGGLEDVEFLEGIAPFLNAYSVGVLEGAEALEVVDTLALSLGEGAVVEGLAGALGGEALLAEVGFDLIEIAIFL